METVINKFNLGMTPDARSGNPFECQLCKNFDNYSQKKLIPYRDSEDAGWSSQATTQLQTFLMYLGSLFGLGIVVGTGKANIAKNTDMAEPSWSSPTNGADSAGSTGFKLFKEYLGILYGSVPSDSAGRIWSYDIAGTTFTSSAQALNHLVITQGLVHSANNCFYIAYKNSTGSYVMSKDGAGAFNTTHLTLPTGFVPTDLAEDGLYLVISGIASDGRFMTIFWDMSANSWDDSKTIVWGEGTYLNTSNPNNFIAEKIDGYLVSVAIEGNVQPKLVFRKSYGGLQTKIKEIYLDSGINTIIGKQKYNNRLFFGLNATSVGGTTYDYTNIWSVGGNGEGGFSINIDRVALNDTLVSRINGFIITQDYFYISYQTAASVYGLSKTNDQESFIITSVYETQKFFAGDSSLVKNLLEASLTCDKLPTNATAKLYYRIDGATSWGTALLTISTADRLSEYINKSIGDYKEIEWRIESYKGAVITGLSFKETIIGKKKQ